MVLLYLFLFARMVLLPVLNREYYSSVILLFVDSYRKFSHNSLYLRISVANNIIVISLKIFSQLLSFSRFPLELIIFPYEMSCHRKKLLLLFTILFFK